MKKRVAVTLVWLGVLFLLTGCSDTSGNKAYEREPEGKDELSVLSETAVETEDGTVLSWAGEDMLYMYPTDVPAEELLVRVKEDGFVVMESGNLVSGEENWHAFLERIKSGGNAQMQIASYYTLNKDRVSAEYYETYKEEYPKLYLSSILFYGGKYWMVTKAHNTNEIENGDFTMWNYLMEYEGEPSSHSAPFSRYEYYVLTNDNTVSWNDLEHGMYSSIMGDYIPHRMVVSKRYYD